MRTIFKKFFLLFVITITSVFVWGQEQVSKQSLETQRNELLEQIQEAKQQLQKIQSSKKSSLAEISYVKKKINLRLKAINIMNQQMIELDNQIKKHKMDIETQTKNIEKLKQQYQKSIVSAYKIGQVYNPSFFLFTSSSFSEFIDKFRFLKKFRSMRVTQLGNIKKSSHMLQKELNNLSQSQASQKKILVEQNDELTQLKQEETQKKVLVKQLKQDEAKISQNIMEKTSQWKKIKKTIEKLIKAEIARNAQRMKMEAKKRANAKNKDNTTETVKSAERKESNITESALIYTDKDFNLAKNFKTNKGRLPWPVSHQTSAITMQFGKNKVTEESRITYDNSGLTFTVLPQSQIKAVFNGVVTNVQEMDEGYLVTIRHGEYWTIYTPVFNVVVKAGQDINTGDVIGQSSSNNQPELEFQILKETTFLNPEMWLKK